MLRYLSSLSVITSNTVLKSSARYVRQSAQRFKENSQSKIKFKVGGVEKLKESSDMKKWLDWLPTEDGKQKSVKYIGTGGLCLIIFGSWCYNVFCLEMFVHEYCLPRDKPLLRILSTESSVLEPSPELRRLSAVCQDRAGLAVDNLDRLIIFNTELLDPVSNGCLRTTQGAAVGLPQHFTAEPDLKSLLVKTGYNRWFKGFKLPDTLSAEDEAELKSCLTLSQEEIKFSVSQSLAKVNSWHSVYGLVVPPCLWLLGYSLGHTINKRLNLFSRPRIFRVASVSWISVSVLLSYLYYINASSLETELDCQEVVCTSLEQLEAGLSYYQKLLRRNVLLRRLLGQESQYYIQDSGEYVPMIYEIEDFRNISTKIKSLQDLHENLSKTE